MNVLIANAPWIVLIGGFLLLMGTFLPFHSTDHGAVLNALGSSTSAETYKEIMGTDSLEVHQSNVLENGGLFGLATLVLALLTALCGWNAKYTRIAWLPAGLGLLLTWFHWNQFNGYKDTLSSYSSLFEGRIPVDAEQPQSVAIFTEISKSMQLEIGIIFLVVGGIVGVVGSFLTRLNKQPVPIEVES